jgi:glutathione S-transferase
MRTLYVMATSPWSERARWALDHHGVHFREVPFLPPLNEPMVRLHARKLYGFMSMPVLVDGRKSYGDSWDIARYADTIGRGSPLFRAQEVEQIHQFNVLSQAGLEAGRAISLLRFLSCERAMLEALPPSFPLVLGRAAVPIAWIALKRTQRKYGTKRWTEGQARSLLRRSLETLRRSLDGREYLLGHFSYADISAAQMLGVVKPVYCSRVPMGPASRRGFTDPLLAGEFADLVSWRDQLYSRHRAENFNAVARESLTSDVACVPLQNAC